MKRFTVRPRLATTRGLRIGNGAEGTDHVLLGRLAEAGPLIAVTHDLSTEHVVAIVGKRGSGKSYTLGSILEGLCTPVGHSPIGSMSGTRSALLFDTLGIFQWANTILGPDASQPIVRRQYEVRKGWDIGVTPLNVSVWVPRTDLDTTVRTRHSEFTMRTQDLNASDFGYLLGLDVLQDRMGQLLNDAFTKVTLEGWSDNSPHPAKADYDIADLIDCVRDDSELEANYQTETRRAVTQQLTTLARNPLFECEGTDLHDLLRPGVLNVIVMNRMSDELRYVLIMALIRRITRARIEASELEKDLAIRDDMTGDEKTRMQEALASGIPPCWIAADEAQNFLPSERRTGAADVLVRLVREGRNYGLSFAITTQQPTAIDPRVMSQVDTLISHKLTVQGDIEYVRRNLKSGSAEEVRFANSVLGFDDVLRALDVGQAIVSNTETDRGYIVDVRPRLGVHGGF